METDWIFFCCLLFLTTKALGVCNKEAEATTWAQLYSWFSFPLLTKLVQPHSQFGPSRAWWHKWPPHWRPSRLRCLWASPRTQRESSRQMWARRSGGSSLPEPRFGPSPAPYSQRPVSQPAPEPGTFSCIIPSWSVAKLVELAIFYRLRIWVNVHQFNFFRNYLLLISWILRPNLKWRMDLLAINWSSYQQTKYLWHVFVGGNWQ